MKLVGVFLLCSGLYAQIGWTDLGPNSVLHNSAFKAGLSALVDCTGTGPAPYCANLGANRPFLGEDFKTVEAQGGAAVDRVHNHLYFTGGGHNDSVSNAFYDFDAATNTITRLTDPSVLSNDYLQVNPDNTAVSTHSEEGLIYLPNEDAVFKWGIGVGPSPLTQQWGWWITNPRTNPTWVAKAPLPGQNPMYVVSGGSGCTNGLQTGTFTNGGGTGAAFQVWVAGGVPTGYLSVTGGGGGSLAGSGYTSVPTTATVSTCTGTVTIAGGAIAGGQVEVFQAETASVCVLDTTAATESVLCVSQGLNQMFRYTPSLDTGIGSSPWTALSAFNGTSIVIGGTCAIDPVHKVMVCPGETFGFGQPSGIYVVDLSAGSSYAATEISASTSGCSALYSVTNPGFEFDSSTGLFVGYVGTGNSVVLFDYASKMCVTRTFSGGPTSAAYVSPGGTYNRFAYLPSLNKYEVMNNGSFDMFSLKLHPDSLGASTITCKDIDGDGYGVGVGCTGPDADDSDRTVNTTATVLSKYGNVQAFLEHIGYQNAASLLNVYCVDPTGSSGTPSTNADTACTTPYPSFASLPALSGPVVVIVRGGRGTYIPTSIINLPAGSSSAQTVFVAYPGEQPFIDESGNTVGAAFDSGGVAYTTVDGFKIASNPNGAGYLTGTFMPYPSTTITAMWNNLYRCEIFGGGNDSNVDGDNNIQLDVEENVVHDPYSSGGQHNIYLGSNSGTSMGVQVRRNILYSVDTGFPNLQFNGRCLYCYWEQNVVYGANGQEIALLEGVSFSFIRGNQVFNTGNPGVGLRMLNYDPGAGNCQVTGQQSICPWDQTGNTFANNTFWTGTLDPWGGGPVQGAMINIVQTATVGPCGNGGSPPCGNMGGNTWINNVMVDFAGNASIPAVYYTDANPVNYLPLDTWQNNIILNGSLAPTSVARAGGVVMNCAAFNAAALIGSGCLNTDPQFVSANVSFYNSPQSFNFKLLSGSPALNAGVLTSTTPTFDILGDLIGTPPVIGAINQIGGALAPLRSVISAGRTSTGAVIQ